LPGLKNGAEYYSLSDLM